MENYNKYYEEVIQRLAATRRKKNLLALGNGFFSAAAISMLFMLLLIIIESIAYGNTDFRTFLAASFLTGTLVLVAAFIIKPLLTALGIYNYPNLNKIALMIGNHFPELRDKLGNALQLVPIIKEENPAVSKDLAAAAFYEVYLESKEKNFSEVLDDKRAKKILVFFLISAVVSIGSINLIPKLGEAFYRTVNYSTSFIPPAPFSLEIEPQDTHKLRSESLLIKVIGKGDVPKKIKLHIKEEQQMNYDEFELKRNKENEFTYEIPSVKHSLTFYAEADWLGTSVFSKIGKVTVTDRPVVRSISGNLIYPNYTQLNPKTFNEQNGDVTALRGSRIELTAFANKDIESAYILFESVSEGNEGDTLTQIKFDTLKFRMRVDGRKAFGRMFLAKNGSYHIKIVDFDGEENLEPIKYNIVTLDDVNPSISLIEPTTDVQLTAQAMLPIRVAINDDYGYSKLVLNYKLIESPYTIPDKDFRQKELPLISSDLTQEIPYIWDLNELAITPEDKYEFFLEIFDNDIVSGPKSARTNTIAIRLPALSEVIDQSERSQEIIEAELSKALEEAQKIKKEIDELNQEMLKNANKKELNWETKKKADELIQKQNQLKDKLNNISESMEQNTKEMQKNNLLSEETLQKFMELQNLLKQVDSPELRQMQKQMQDAMKQMSPEELKKAMQEMKFSDEQIRKSIERSMKMLKRIQAEQKTDALSKQADKLKEQQDKISEELKNTAKDDKKKIDELSNKQDYLKKEVSKLEEDMKKLEELMKEIGEKDMPMEDLKKANEELNAQQTQQEMQQSKENMQNQEKQKAQQNQKNASQNLQNFSQQMQKMKENMKKQSTEEAIRKMQKQISDLLDISQSQEDLQSQTKNSSYNSANMPEYAKSQQQQLNQLMNVAKEMLKLSEKSFAITPEMGENISNAMQQMQQSINDLAERRSHQAANSQNGAMSSINKAVSQMQSMVSQMQQGKGACSNPGGMGEGEGQGNQMGLSQQMQQMAAQQQMLNQSLQQMMQQGQMGGGSGMSQEQRAQMQRLQQQQGDAAKSAKELAEEQKKFSNGDKETAKKMDDIAKEMQEVVKDIQSGNISEETLKRQERILSRLLDANRSINKRDFEKQRESKTGKNYRTESPESLDMMSDEGKKRTLRDLMKENKAKYSKDFELLINSYFESLESVDFSKEPVENQ